MVGFVVAALVIAIEVARVAAMVVAIATEAAVPYPLLRNKMETVLVLSVIHKISYFSEI